ncbi:hypothetical protein HpCK98_05550 [Helicobacter pylori]
MCRFHRFSFLSQIKITPSIKSKKKELKFLKKPQFAAELIQKNKKALRKASSNLLKIRVSHKNDTA